MNARVAITWIGLALAVVGGFEGVRRVAYQDVVGVWTVCAGETKGVSAGDTYTLDECKAMLETRLAEFNDGVNRCLRIEVRDETRVALVSFAYNIGVPAFCKSTLLRRLNAGDGAAACDELLRWTYADGRQLPGLVNRRAAERELCRAGFAGQVPVPLERPTRRA